MTIMLSDPEACVDEVIRRVGREIVLGAPIGIGKPIHVLNAFYRRACDDESITLKIVTGLTISRPRVRSDIEHRFLDPIIERLFGNFPDAEYARAYTKNTLPENVTVVEFYMKAGAFLRNPAAQQHYISTNYSHVGRDMLLQGVNVFAQAISRRGEGDDASYSLSSNSDSLSLFPGLRAAEASGSPMVVIGQVNPKLPFMTRDAEVGTETFDIIVDNRDLYHDLFAAPNAPVSTADHLIGLHASTLIPDGGTIQIGIGSLGDAIASACGIRNRDNQTYRGILERIGILERCGDEIGRLGGTDRFEQGLYGSTEMFADCFRSLYQDGILKREVFADATLQRLASAHGLSSGDTARAFDLAISDGVISGQMTADHFEWLKRTGIFRADISLDDDLIVAGDGERLPADVSDPGALSRLRESCLGDRLLEASIVHAGFFLGPTAMYEMLSGLGPAERDKFCMTGIGYVNELHGHEEIAKLQRKNARFVNTAMMMTVLGAACSDGLENGQVVSGVGGQYNFVAMAHALDGARSVLTLRSTRTKDGTTSSNIVSKYGHTTIPRHLRDVVVTEYGIADLRGRQDHEVIQRMLCIADSRFQEGLRQEAVEAGKLSPDYRIPAAFRHNLPERLEDDLASFREAELFGKFPLGSDLSHEEQVLGEVLTSLKARATGFSGVAGLLAETVLSDTAEPAGAAPYLARLGLDEPSGLRDTMLRRAVISELVKGGFAADASRT